MESRRRTKTIDLDSNVEARPRLGTKALLIGAPLLTALGRVLLVPLNEQDWSGVMTSMAANKGRSDAGWLLTIVASGLLGITAVVLAGRLRLAGRVRSAMFIMVTTAIGWAATAAICFHGLYLSVAANAPDRAAQVRIQEELNDGWSIGLVFLMTGIAAIGYLALAFGLARASVVTKGAAILIGVGGATTLIISPTPLKPLLVLTALLLAAGHALAVRTEA